MNNEFRFSRVQWIHTLAHWQQLEILMKFEVQGGECDTGGLGGLRPAREGSGTGHAARQKEK